MKFEVGKKYWRNDPNVQSKVHEMRGYSSNGRRVIFECNNQVQLFDAETLARMSWVEYVEPKVHTRYIFWWKRPDGGVFTTSADIRGKFVRGDTVTGTKLLQVDTLTYTENE